jgi:glutathione S-transferase
MKLLWSSRSPYVRKVMVAAHERGLADRIERVPSLVSSFARNEEVSHVNPLNKIPTLVLDDGSALFDSRVIVEYLDGIGSASRLIPLDPVQRLQALRIAAVGDGAIDHLILALLERRRPADKTMDGVALACLGKVRTALHWLETGGDLPADAPLTIAHVSIGAALAYADFRFSDLGWRKDCPRLAAWFDAISQRPSFTATIFVDKY